MLGGLDLSTLILKEGIIIAIKTIILVDEVQQLPSCFLGSFSFPKQCTSIYFIMNIYKLLTTSIMVLMAMIMPSLKISVLKSSPPSIATFGYVYLNKR
jgi:hypothetical protein